MRRADREQSMRDFRVTSRPDVALSLGPAWRLTRVPSSPAATPCSCTEVDVNAGTEQWRLGGTNEPAGSGVVEVGIGAGRTG